MASLDRHIDDDDTDTQSDYGRGRVLSSSEPKEGIGYTV